MSPLNAILCKFKDNLKIPFHIVTKDWTENIFNITVYWKESNMNIRKVLDCLNFLFAKYDLSKMGYCPFNVKEIISQGRLFLNLCFLLQKTVKKKKCPLK